MLYCGATPQAPAVGASSDDHFPCQASVLRSRLGRHTCLERVFIDGRRAVVLSCSLLNHFCSKLLTCRMAPAGELPVVEGMRLGPHLGPYSVASSERGQVTRRPPVQDGEFSQALVRCCPFHPYPSKLPPRQHSTRGVALSFPASSGANVFLSLPSFQKSTHLGTHKPHGILSSP